MSAGLFFPFASLGEHQRELGLVVAVLIGFAFGFVLERAGFGQADKLAAQFYLRDMRVFKVMFTAIVTAMLGVLLASGLGLIHLGGLSESAASETFLGSMVIGGVLLGVGFIVSGYCPGTSAVAASSGNLDGLITFAGVMLGSVVFAEGFPLLGKLAGIGGKGHLFLYDLLGVPAPLLAGGVTAMALLAFVGAEKVERWMARKRGVEGAPPKRRPRRLAFSLLGGASLLVIATLALPLAPRAATAPRTAGEMGQARLARRILDEPWSLRILDLRREADCLKERLPGAECTPAAILPKLGLAYAPGDRDLVLVGRRTLRPPPAALSYRGRVYVLRGGFERWRTYALTAPRPPDPGASEAVKAAHRFRSALHSAMTGRKPPPPPKAEKTRYKAPKKKKGGGCG